MRQRQISAVFGLLALFTTCRAHTWVEQLTIIASNGTFVGPTGYPRGNVLRTSPFFGDGQMTYLLPPNGLPQGNVILPTDRMCKSSQTFGNQTEGSPALRAAPGDMVALRYQENGHVTIPTTQVGKPANRGTVYIYGTTEASDSDLFLNIHNVWNAAGTGGDKRGVLLATRNYDDGQCYQINGQPLSDQRAVQFPHANISPMGVNLWCQADVTLPTSINAASYTLYWVWDWPTAPSAAQPKGLTEIYTTCMDITVGSGPGTSNGKAFIQGQDLNFAAIESELSTSFIVAPTASGTPVSATNVVPPAIASAPSSSQAAAAPTTSAPAGGFITVTETLDAIIQQVTVTVTKTFGTPAAASSTAKPSVAASSAILNIQPFLPASSSSLKTQISASKPSTTSPPAVQTTSVTSVNIVTVEMTQVVTITTHAARPTIRGRVV